MATVESLEARLEEIEAINAIRNLMAEYTHYYDTGWSGAGRDADRVGACFLEDGVWDIETAGRHVGRQNIRDYCATIGHHPDVMSVHILMNPKIEVDGDSATGAWTGFIPMVTPDGDALWICGRYECQFRRKDDAWKIAELRMLNAFQTPYDVGFAKMRAYVSETYAAAVPDAAG